MVIASVSTAVTIDINEVVRLLVLLLLIALVVILVTRRLSVPYTLGLIVVGLFIGFFHVLPGARLTPDLVLIVFLPALLFQGAWELHTAYLRAHWLAVLLLAGPGVLLSLLVIAVPVHFLTGIDWLTSLLLGAILSPTDPVAVLGLFRQLKVDIGLSTIIEGESLFNDGMAGTLYSTFLTFVLLSIQGTAPTGASAWLDGILNFGIEAGGGALIGLGCGYLVSRLVRLIDEPLIETTITLVTAYGIYLLADALHTSGILAVILAALLLGSYGRRIGMSEHTREAVDTFWDMLAFLANALIFLLVGAQLNPTEFFIGGTRFALLITALLALATVLLARLVLVLCLLVLNRPLRMGIERPWRVLIFWSGLRGALSLALVLALPLIVPDRDALVFSTYAVVFFTLLVQGFSLRWVLKHLPSVAAR